MNANKAKAAAMWGNDGDVNVGNVVRRHRVVGGGVREIGNTVEVLDREGKQLAFMGGIGADSDGLRRAFEHEYPQWV